MDWFENLNPIIQALIAGIFTWSITLFGSLVVYFFKNTNNRILTTILGFSAGVMIAASFWSLITPSIELSSELGYIKWLLPALGFITGGVLVLLSDKFFDKVLKNKNNKENTVLLKRIILLIAAITIHNIPEGMAIGVAFGGIGIENSGITLISAIMLAIGIGIQNFPEGAAVSLPLRNKGFSKFKAFMYGQCSAIVEPIAAVIGAVLVLFVKSVLPFLLAFAAGAMIIVVARELLPEAVNKNKNFATLGLILGFVLMMILDVALG